MMRNMVMLSVISAGLLAACGQQAGVPASGVAAYSSRPELQDTDSQAILARYGNDPGLLAALQAAYGERAPETVQASIPTLNGLSLEGDRLAYVKSVGWGSVGNYNGQYAVYAFSALPYPGLDWSRDGCSAPDGLGLGYRSKMYVDLLGYGRRKKRSLKE